jgi:uncharacterized membrane protein
MPKMPRPLKYVWGVVISGLLLVSMTMDRGSIWWPLVNQLIDIVQQSQPLTPGR